MRFSRTLQKCRTFNLTPGMHFIVADDYGCPRSLDLSHRRRIPDPNAWLVDEIDRSSTTTVTAWNNEDPFPTERTGNGAPYIIGIETFPYYYHRGHRLIPWYYNRPCSTNIRWSSTMTLVRPTVTGHLPSLFELGDVHSLSAPLEQIRVERYHL